MLSAIDEIYLATLAFSPDGTTLASGSRTGTVRMWDVATGEPLATLTGHTDTVEALAYFHPMAKHSQVQVQRPVNSVVGYRF